MIDLCSGIFLESSTDRVPLRGRGSALVLHPRVLALRRSALIVLQKHEAKMPMDEGPEIRGGRVIVYSWSKSRMKLNICFY